MPVKTDRLPPLSSRFLWGVKGSEGLIEIEIQIWRGKNETKGRRQEYLSFHHLLSFPCPLQPNNCFVQKQNSLSDMSQLSGMFLHKMHTARERVSMNKAPVLAQMAQGYSRDIRARA